LDNLLFPIESVAEEARTISARLELEKQQGNTMDIGEIYSKNPRMLAVSSSNRIEPSPG
jgi:hypothetical protein